VKKTIQLTVNGEAVTAEVEPRLQLAEFLREHLLLTGTHLGCEHGVCGACTIEMDGAPARSCIAYAVACSGAAVRTIEGFDDDPLMAELREAFSAEHALQCGFCTPGMLVSARDIALRLPDADESRIRKELAGNLCRCTGYVGIVRAIQRVLANRRGICLAPVAETPRGTGQSETEQRKSQVSLAPVGESGGGAERSGRGQTANEFSPAPIAESREGAERWRKGNQLTQPALHQSFTVDHPRNKVWDFFGRLDEVTSCLPGASVVGTPTPEKANIRMRVKVGPIVADFEGAAEVARDPSSYSGVIQGSARDARSSSLTRGEVRYVLAEENGGTATRVAVDVDYTLTGTLAQFSRSGIVQDIARRLTAAFAANLEARLGADQSGAPGDARADPRAAELNAGSLLLSAVWERIKRLFRSLMKKSP
jgi:carbon-monoxide dehydrogenase small subunit